MPVKTPKEAFLMVLSHVRQGTERSAKVYEEIAELAEDPQIFAYTRTLSQDRVIVMANLSERPASISEGIGIVFDHKNLLLKNYEIEKHEPTERITLKPYETRVYRL